MTENTSDAELCSQYLDKNVEDDNQKDIILRQDADEDNMDGGNDDIDENGEHVQEFINGDDIDDDELYQGNIFMDTKEIPTSKFTPTLRITGPACDKTPTAKVGKLTAYDEQIIATESCEFSQNEGNSDDPDYQDNDETVPLGPYQCMKCLYNTNKKRLLVSHLRSHSVIRNKCSVCHKSFKYKKYLKKHLAVHMGITTFQCPDCDQTYPSSWKLSFHRKQSHSGMKPHQCTVCGYSVFELHVLKRHMRSHTDERPHKCGQCTHASRTAFALKVHMRSHTKEKPFACEICDARYQQVHNWKMHMIKRHNLMIK